VRLESFLDQSLRFLASATPTLRSKSANLQGRKIILLSAYYAKMDNWIASPACSRQTKTWLYSIVEVDAVAASMITVRVLVEIFKAHEAMGSGIMGLSSQFVSPVRPGSGECLIE